MRLGKGQEGLRNQTVSAGPQPRPPSATINHTTTLRRQTRPGLPKAMVCRVQATANKNYNFRMRSVQSPSNSLQAVSQPPENALISAMRALEVAVIISGAGLAH